MNKEHPIQINFFKTTSGKEPELDMLNKHIGSSFDDFLEEEGILPEVEATAIKRLLDYQIKNQIEKENIYNTSLGQNMRAGLESRKFNITF